MFVYKGGIFIILKNLIVTSTVGLVIVFSLTSNIKISKDKLKTEVQNKYFKIKIYDNQKSINNAYRRLEYTCKELLK